MGVVGGVLIMGVQNDLDLMMVSPYLQQIFRPYNSDSSGGRRNENRR